MTQLVYVFILGKTVWSSLFAIFMPVTCEELIKYSEVLNTVRIIIKTIWNKVNHRHDVLLGVEGRVVTSSYLVPEWHQALSVTHGVLKAEFDLRYISVSGTAEPLWLGPMALVKSSEPWVPGFCWYSIFKLSQKDKENVLYCSVYFLSVENWKEVKEKTQYQEQREKVAGFLCRNKISVFGVAWNLTLGLLETELEMRILVRVIYDLFSKCS